MIGIYRKRFSDLQSLYPSPYFNSCLVRFDGEDDCREFYFSKFSFDRESIYSWASPIAQIRFEIPGHFSFESSGSRQSGEILRKDQYLISDGKILFLSTENMEEARALIYQEYFSTRKTAFVLPEIVAQMEKAQDQVVRAEYGGPLVVTGPAGSGKTTLALHRVAYLLQSPETADKLSSGDAIVFVQDESTRDYFSHLLPELGIKDVEITTLAAWAKKILPLDGWRISDREKDSDADYAWAKIKAIRSSAPSGWRKDWFSILSEVYADHLNMESSAKLAVQKKTKTLDRLDLAVLLKADSAESGGLEIEKEYYCKAARSNELKRKTGKFKTDYKLMIIDEFQNYLPDQLEIFRKAMNAAAGESVYIGDFNQRVRLGTVDNISALGGVPAEERMVKLSKVYRNTKEILGYLKDLGFNIEVPEVIKSGPAVEEMALNVEEEMAFVKSKLRGLADVSVGILSHNEKAVERYRLELAEQKNVKVMPLIDSQGVEFDTVFLVGADEKLLSVAGLPEDLRPEMGKIKHDLLYIALTRATNALCVTGQVKLSELK